MVPLDILSPLRVNKKVGGRTFKTGRIARDLVEEPPASIFDRIDHFEAPLVELYMAAVSDLTSHLRVEWCMIENEIGGSVIDGNNID